MPNALPRSRAHIAEQDQSEMPGQLGVARLRFCLLTLVRDPQQDDLSLRQLAVLALAVSTPGPHTVRGLAATLRVGKPAITRAVDRLGRFGFAQRRPDPADGRSILVKATPRGIRLIKTISAGLM
jgi:DNA-binding MarR family transcriptional regulator